MSEILSEQAAQEALFTAMQEDGSAPRSYGEEGAGAAPAVDEAAAALAAQREASSQTQQDSPQGETNTATQTTEAVTEEQFTRLDPNTIPEELKPWYQSMQADYTRKTQAIAEQRKQLEGISDVEAAQQALTFYNSLHDPTFAKTFYEQLGGTLTNLGYLEQRQAVQAAQELETQQAAQTATTFDDPEQFFQAKAAELDAKYSAIEARLEAQRVEAENAQAYAAYAGEVQRQESILRDANPHYTDTDIAAVYAMAGTNSNLIAAAEQYETAVADRLNRMMAAKTMVQTTVGAPAPTGSATEPPNFGDNLELAHKAAQERLQQILAANQ